VLLVSANDSFIRLQTGDVKPSVRRCHNLTGEATSSFTAIAILAFGTGIHRVQASGIKVGPNVCAWPFDKVLPLAVLPMHDFSRFNCTP
jgi:hypothetical protein